MPTLDLAPDFHSVLIGYSEMSETQDPPRTVYLPLQAIEKCSICDSTTGNLRLCSSCNESVYCGERCQKQDWPTHKNICGKTDKIELSSFYPLLACLVENSHLHRDIPVHPALVHQIVNNPAPDAHPTDFGPSFGGWCSKAVILGPTSVNLPNTEEWWPEAASPMVRGKLMRRIVREGHVLPILTAVCLSLLSEMYTTTSGGGSRERRARLRYKSSPISDFGIAAGSARVTIQDRLGYFCLSDGSLISGQDPDQHFWIYFTTARGEELILDCSLFTFNMCVMVDGVGSYVPQLGAVSPHVPAFFRDRVLREDTIELHTERKRVSVLRNEALHRAILHMQTGFDQTDMATLSHFMEGLSGRPCSQKDKELLATFSFSNCHGIADTLNNRRWSRYPTTPAIVIEQDPGDTVGTPAGDDGSEDWFRYMKKWKKLKKSGKVGDEGLAEAFNKWQDGWNARRNSSSVTAPRK